MDPNGGEEDERRMGGGTRCRDRNEDTEGEGKEDKGGSVKIKGV